MSMLCLRCNGSGYLYDDGSNGDLYDYHVCPDCGGESVIQRCPKSPDGKHEYALEGAYTFSPAVGVCDDIQESRFCRWCGHERTE